MDIMRIVVASPGDVKEERDRVNVVADELNRTFSADHDLRLEVVRWETDSYPGFHVDGPQGLIDSVLRIEDCDCLIGIFWKRFGSPVKDSRSGTEHEIRKAVEAWKRSKRPEIMVYFSDREASIHSKEEAEQWGAVREFQKAFPPEGLWWSYKTADEFERLVRTHLMQLIPQVLTSRTAAGPAGKEIADRVQYMKTYKDLINCSAEQILLFASKFHRSEAMDEAAEINQALGEARQRGVEVRVLLGMAYDRLPAALELSGCGVLVRFDPTLSLSDINYAIFDGRTALISLRESSNDRSIYKRSVASTEFTSVQLASTLRREFDRRWRTVGTRSIGLFLREVIPTAVKELGIGAVADQLHLPAKKIETFAQRNPVFIALIGRPGSGKSTVAHELRMAVSSSMPSFRLSHISDLPFLSRAFLSTEPSRFVKTEDNGFFVTDKALYHEALADLANQSRGLLEDSDVIIAEFARNDYKESLEVLRQNGVEPDLIVYIDVPFAVACERNRLRAASRSGHYVSDREMTETYSSDDISILRQDPRVVVLPNDVGTQNIAERATLGLLEQIRTLTQSV